MSKNWTMTEVANAINNNEMESVLDFGKRFPVATNLMTAALAGDKKSTMALFNAFPEYMTMGKIDKALKTQIEEGTFGTPATRSADKDADADDDSNNADEETREKPAKSEKPAEKKAAVSSGNSDLSSKTSSELYYLGKEVGLKGAELKCPKAELISRIEAAQKGGKVPETAANEKKADKATKGEKSKYDGKTARELYTECKDKGIEVEQKKNAQYYIDALEEADKDASEDASDVDYSKMSAKEIYGICKEKGLEPEQKKPVKYYLDLLASADEDEADSEDDGWNDDEEKADEKPAKPDKKKTSGKPDKKSEDDEWEI